jgi:hypothetical protein
MLDPPTLDGNEATGLAVMVTSKCIIVLLMGVSMKVGEVQP